MNNISNVVYINLDSRPDRQLQTVRELTKIGVRNATRFGAISHSNGCIGCFQSHIQVLTYAIKNRLNHVLIVEDDVMFTSPDLLTAQLARFMENHKPKRDWDVLMLGGNNIGDVQSMDDTCVQVKRCYSAVAYLVSGHYMTTLLAHLKEGIRMLIRHPTQKSRYAIDVWWTHLQIKHKWLLLVPLSVSQYPSYSNIENKETNYHNVMLTLVKRRV